MTDLLALLEEAGFIAAEAKRLGEVVEAFNELASQARTNKDGTVSFPNDGYLKFKNLIAEE